MQRAFITGAEHGQGKFPQPLRGECDIGLDAPFFLPLGHVFAGIAARMFLRNWLSIVEHFVDTGLDRRHLW